MSKVYFHKNGRIGLSYSNGTPIEFERLADQRNVIALDEEADAKKVADLRAYITKRIGGMSEIDGEEYDTLKKTLQYDPSASFLKQSPPRLFNSKVEFPKARPAQPPVQVAAGLVSAGPVEEGNPAEPVEGRVGGRPIPIARGRKLRTGKLDPANSESAPVSESPAPAPTPTSVAESAEIANLTTTDQ